MTIDNDMATLGQHTPCGLIMGFSLDMLVEFMNYDDNGIIIDAKSINIISNSYKYAFKNYFMTDQDRIVVYPPHDVKITDEETMHVLSWGTGVLRGGAVTYVLQFNHHYLPKYVKPESDNGNAAIRLDYNGTEFMILDGLDLDPVPKRLITQAIQKTIKMRPSLSILLKQPAINISDADTAIDLRRIVLFNDNNKLAGKLLSFEVDIDRQKHVLGQFEANGISLIGLNKTFLIKKNESRLRISVNGVSVSKEYATTDPLGYASNLHHINGDNHSLFSLAAWNSELDLKLLKDMINVKIDHCYKPVQTVINSVLKGTGVEIKTCDDVKNKINSEIDASFLPLAPNYALEYSIRPLKPTNVSTNFLGLSLNADTNSLSLKFDYVINGVKDSSSSMTSAAGFVYPYGLGMVISENLLNKIFQAYLANSFVLSKTFCSDYRELIPLMSDDLAYFYSLRVKSGDLFIDSAKVHMGMFFESAGDVDKDISIIRYNNAEDKKTQSLEIRYFPGLKKVLTDTGLTVLERNKLTLITGKIKYDGELKPLENIKEISEKLYEKLVNLFLGVKINLLDLPDRFTVEGRDRLLSYNSVNVNVNEIVIGSKVQEQKKLIPVQKPDRPLPLTSTVDADLVPKDKWGEEGSGKRQFNIPSGIALKESAIVDYLYIVDRENSRVQKLTSKGKFLMKWGFKGDQNREFNNPNGAAIDSSGNVYIADSGNNRIQKFDPEGRFIAKWYGKGNNSNENNKEDFFFMPQGIAIDGFGNVYVSDSNHFIYKFDSSGKFLKQWGGKGDGNGKFHSPRGISVDEKGCLYVADAGNHRIQKLNARGKMLAKWGSRGNEDGCFCYPQGVVVDKYEKVYVTDTGNNRIQIFNDNGQFISKVSCKGISCGQISAPWGIAVDRECNIFVADSFNHRIQKFGP